MQNIIIVDTPFELLCGIEFILEEKLYLDNAIYLIAVNNKSENNLLQIRNLYKQHSKYFDNYEEVSIKSKTLVFRFYYYLYKYYIIQRKLNKLNINYLILGDYANCYFRHIGNKTRSIKTIALDDGFATLKTFNSFDFTNTSLTKKEKIKKIASLGSYDSKYKNVCLYTIFYDKINYQNRKKNALLNTQKKVLNSIHKNEMFIIGTPVVEDGIVEESVYRFFLKEISKKSNHDKIIYLPHRREDPNKLNSISAYNNIEIRWVNTLVELYILENLYLPSLIISFFSTSLINLKLLVGTNCDIKFFRIPEQYLLSRKSHIANIYDLLAQELAHYNLEKDE